MIANMLRETGGSGELRPVAAAIAVSSETLYRFIRSGLLRWRATAKSGVRGESPGGGNFRIREKRLLSFLLFAAKASAPSCFVDRFK